MKRNTIYIGILIAFASMLYFYYSSAPELGSSSFKCPESYTENDADTEEYRNALIKWTSVFFETHPKATSSDWSVAKYQLWVDNSCTVAIERSKLSGEVSDLKKWELVDYEVQNSLDKAINSAN